MNTSFSITRLDKTFGVIVEGLKLADLKKIDETEMINLTTKNFENLFFN